MPQSTRPYPREINDPVTLPESTRDYYRSTWGFDPVVDCRIVGSGRFQYEECFPLSQDLPLQSVGVTICARVDWEGEEIHNRIVFRRPDDNEQMKEASVECTHTVVYAGPASDALDFADDLDQYTNMTRANRARLIRTRRLVILPPWEHFASLKSYIAAVGDMGVITLLRQSIMAPTESTDGLPFGFNAEMQQQVARALRAIAPSTMASIYRDLTCEFLDTHPNLAQVEQWMHRSSLFVGKSKRRHWGLVLRHLDTPTLVHLFRHTDIADSLQDRLFFHPEILAKALAITPDLPWDTLRLEWQARQYAERMERVTYHDRGRLNEIPPAEVWARVPFCEYLFPHDILSLDSTNARRSRVQAYLREMTKVYTETDVGEPLTDRYLDWVQRVSSQLDDFLKVPFPVDRVRPNPICHWDSMLKRNVGLTPVEVVDRIEHGDHGHRRNIVLCYPIPPELQVKLITHWDFATRLALVGNPGTDPTVIAMLAQDPQPCVRLAAVARVRRGTAAFEPLFGEILDPGEIVWLFASHPGVFFQFGVTTWGDGSEAYRNWFKTRLHENKQRRYLRGVLYAWAYSEGVFLEDSERGPHGSHLAYSGLTDRACGQLPCLYLGPHFLCNSDDRFDL